MRKIGIFALIIAVVAWLISTLPVAGGITTGDTFVANLSGAEEVPTVDTLAHGQAFFQLSPDGTELSFKLMVTNIEDAVASHIHLAPAGSNGPVVASLFGGTPSGPFTGVLAQGTITSAELVGPLAGSSLNVLIVEMNAGNTYVNVHTLANSPGEIRGQIR
jgi:hypothetical protein